MCQICVANLNGMSGFGDVLLPFVTRLRQIYQKTCLYQNGKKKNMDLDFSKQDGGGLANTYKMQVLPLWTFKDCSQELTEESAPDSVTDYHSINDSVLPSSPGDHPGCITPPFNLQRNGIRVLLFRECDTRGRKLLYDSKTVVRIPISDCSPAVPSCKTLFKSSWSTGSSQSTGNASAGSATHFTSNKGSASNVKSSATSSSSKSESFAEISNGYGYQVWSLMYIKGFSSFTLFFLYSLSSTLLNNNWALILQTCKCPFSHFILLCFLVLPMFYFTCSIM